MSRLHLILLATIMLSACKGQRTESTQQEADTLATCDTCDIAAELEAERQERELSALPQTIDETFDDFIFLFATGERFQRRRICFPLHVNAFGDDLVVESKEWNHIDLFDGRDYYTTLFNRTEDADIEKDSSISEVRLEQINLDDSVVVALLFNRQEGKWKLTRYSVSALSEHPLAQFLLFYQRFVSEPDFCQHAIASSVRYTTTDPDDDFQQIEGTITPDQWSAFAPVLPQHTLTHIDYGQLFTNPHQIVLVKRGIANGMLDELTFKRSAERGWSLVAYEN